MTQPFQITALVLLLTGCAAYSEFIEAPAENPRLAAVKSNLDAHAGAPVRWGGTIVSVENEEGATWIEVLERKLDRYGYPDPHSQSDGRFFIKEGSVLDPKVYAEGRRITVRGTLSGSVEKQVNDQPYLLPTVESEQHSLWGNTRPYANYRRYYPYYDPYYFLHRPYYYPFGYHHDPFFHSHHSRHRHFHRY